MAVPLKNYMRPTIKLKCLLNIDEELTPSVSQMADIYYGLEEFLMMINSKLDELNYYPEELDEIESRLNELQMLKRKYRMDIEEIMTYHAQIVEELAQVEDFDHYEKNLHEELKNCSSGLN